MIAGWLVKLLVSIAVIGFLIVELGTPLIVRSQLDDAAHDVANAGAFEYFQHKDIEAARTRARAVAEQEDVALPDSAFVLQNDGTIKVTLAKKAKSYLFHRLSFARSWYDVRVSATATPKEEGDF